MTFFEADVHAFLVVHIQMIAYKSTDLDKAHLIVSCLCIGQNSNCSPLVQMPVEAVESRTIAITVVRRCFPITFASDVLSEQ